jgi:formylglycine-generating enzyme required for sulfatase activity
MLMKAWRTELRGRASGALLLLFCAGCSSSADMDYGAEGEACRPDGTCDEDLVCLMEACFRPLVGEDELARDPSVLGLDWVPIAGGTFDMGGNSYVADSACQYGTCLPLHSVEVGPFELLQTEVSQQQFELVMGGDPSCNYRGFHSVLCPVECVTPAEAREFCRRVGGRLPTEAEWEFAATAGVQPERFSGYLFQNKLQDAQWIGSANKGEVGTSVPSSLGLYDMIGNVQEIVDDCYHENYIGAPSQGYPAWLTDCDERPSGMTASVMRGCNYTVWGPSLWCGYIRYPIAGRNSGAGFRCAK